MGGVFFFIDSFWPHWVFVAVLAFSSNGEWGLFFSCSSWASHCRGFLCCRALSQEHGLSSCAWV